MISIYAAKLSERGHNVRVICPRRKRKSWQQWLRDLRAGRIWRRKPSHSHFDGRAISVEHVDRPITDRKLPNADIIVATWWETAEWVASLSPHKGTKVYFVQHHELHSRHTRVSSAATYRLPFKKICVASWLADTMQAVYADHACVVVPNAVDLIQFHASPHRIRERPTVGFMYSTAKFKGCDVCIEAIQIAKRNVPNLRVLAFGKRRPDDRTIVQFIDEFYASPPQDQIREIYAKCDAWLFASRSEGFGLPILESMACRTPVIGTPAGAAPELISEGGGLLVNPDNPDDMAGAIQAVVSMSDTEWKTMSDAAYRTAISYSWDDATDLLEQALVAAVEGRWEAHCKAQQQKRAAFARQRNVGAVEA